MPITLGQYLARQDEAVIASYADLDWCICAAISPAALIDLAGKRAASVETVNAGEVYIVTRKGHRELWVRARRSDYATPFRTFCAGEGFATTGVPAGYNVDHLFNKERAATLAAVAADPLDPRLPPESLVRMVLVDSSVNQSFGGLMEKAMVGTGNKWRPVRRFTPLQLCKALGIHANRFGSGLGGGNLSANVAAMIQDMQARNIFARTGISAAQMRADLMTQADTVTRFAGRP